MNGSHEQGSTLPGSYAPYQPRQQPYQQQYQQQSVPGQSGQAPHDSQGGKVMENDALTTKLRKTYRTYYIVAIIFSLFAIWCGIGAIVMWDDCSGWKSATGHHWAKIFVTSGVITLLFALAVLGFSGWALHYNLKTMSGIERINDARLRTGRAFAQYAIDNQGHYGGGGSRGFFYF